MKYCLDCLHYKKDTIYCRLFKTSARTARSYHELCGQFGRRHEQKKNPFVVIWTVVAISALLIFGMFWV